MSVQITIPWDDHVVTKNSKIVTWRGGKPRLSTEWKTGLENIQATAEEQVDDDLCYDEPIHVAMVLYEPTAHHRDILNYTQILMDGLEGVVFTDDYHINAFSIMRGDIDRENPRVEIFIEALGAQKGAP